MAGKLIQFRMDPQLAARLDEDAQAAGVTRSDLARFHLERALGNDAERAAAKTVIWSILAKMRQNEAGLTHELRRLVEQYVTGTFGPRETTPAAEEEHGDEEQQWGEGATDGLPRR